MWTFGGTFVCTWYVLLCGLLEALLSVLGTQQGRAQSLNGVSRLMVRMSGK